MDDLPDEGNKSTEYEICETEGCTDAPNLTVTSVFAEDTSADSTQKTQRPPISNRCPSLASSLKIRQLSAESHLTAIGEDAAETGLDGDGANDKQIDIFPPYYIRNKNDNLVVAVGSAEGVVEIWRVCADDFSASDDDGFRSEHGAINKFDASNDGRFRYAEAGCGSPCGAGTVFGAIEILKALKLSPLGDVVAITTLVPALISSKLLGIVTKIKTYGILAGDLRCCIISNVFRSDFFSLNDNFALVTGKIPIQIDFVGPYQVLALCADGIIRGHSLSPDESVCFHQSEGTFCFEIPLFEFSPWSPLTSLISFSVVHSKETSLIAISSDGQLRLYDVIEAFDKKQNQSPETNVPLDEQKFHHIGEGPLTVINIRASNFPTGAGKYTGLNYENLTNGPATAPIQIYSVKKLHGGRHVSEENLKMDAKTCAESGELSPDRRLHFWKIRLRLPRNRDAFRDLLRRGTHPSLADFQRRYPLRDENMLHRVRTVLSVLLHWAPALKGFDFLPVLVFPFVAVFRSDVLSSLETLITIICRFFLNRDTNFFFPDTSMLHWVKMVLQQKNPSLLEHFQYRGVDTDITSGLLLKSFFTAVFPRDDWLKLWDHIIANIHDEFFLYSAVAAFSLYHAKCILNGKNRFDLFIIYSEQHQKMDMNKFIYLIYEVYREFRLFPLSTDSLLENNHCSDSYVSSDSHWFLRAGAYPDMTGCTRIGHLQPPTKKNSGDGISVKDTVPFPKSEEDFKNTAQINGKEDIRKDEGDKFHQRRSTMVPTIGLEKLGEGDSSLSPSGIIVGSGTSAEESMPNNMDKGKTDQHQSPPHTKNAKLFSVEESPIQRILEKLRIIREKIEKSD